LPASQTAGAQGTSGLLCQTITRLHTQPDYPARRKSHKKRRDDLERLASIPDNEERLVLATGRYIGEGFDDARLDTLFLALPASWKGTLIQYAGRLHRLHPDKTEVHIYDYVDRNVPVLARMFERRLSGYRAIGYSTKRLE
jgi:superfamily II DNA or RNA helicase